MSDSRTPLDTFPAMYMWVVYDHPSDYPNHFVARRWVITGYAGNMPTADFITASTYPELRDFLDRTHLHPIARCPGDDPCIKEVWL